jgi:hypothetical protein
MTVPHEVRKQAANVLDLNECAAKSPHQMRAAFRAKTLSQATA